LQPAHWPAWLVLLLLMGVGLLPRKLLRGLGHLLGWCGFWLAPKQRRIAQTNLRLCFPTWSERARRRLIKRHFRLAARCLMDLGLLWVSGRRRLQRLVQIQGGERIQAYQAEGRAVILLTPHTLALEHGAAALTQAWPGVGLVRPLRNPVVEWVNHRMRTRYQAVLFTRQQGLRSVLKALRAGAFFYYLPDQDRGAERSVFVPFFAEPKATLPTLGRLARLSNAVVLPTVCRYAPELDCYRVEVGQPLRDFPSDDATADAARMNREIAALIEPDLAQYMWTLRLFRSRPPGKAKVY